MTLHSRHPPLARDDDRGLMAWAIAVAVVLHLGVLALRLPDAQRRFAPPRPEPPEIHFVPLPPPPPVDPPRARPRDASRLLPVPDPTPRAPEPVREPRRPAVDPALVEDEPLIGIIEPPPADVRWTPGLSGVSQPEIVPETRVAPVYPEAARRARQQAELVLQAVILRDGSVTEVQVLRCSLPGLGFEQSAVEAVRQWRYRPATRNGEPVEVYLTIVVAFELR